jgi:hypothetical protein
VDRWDSALSGIEIFLDEPWRRMDANDVQYARAQVLEHVRNLGGPDEYVA